MVEMFYSAEHDDDAFGLVAASDDGKMETAIPCDRKMRVDRD